MAVLTANGIAVAEGVVVVPLIGRAVAQLKLAATGEDITITENEPLKLEFDDGTVYQMFVKRAGIQNGSWWSVIAAGGNGGIQKSIKSKFYENIPRATIIRDLLLEAGEGIEAITAPEVVPNWSRMASRAWLALTLAMPENSSWRVLPNGKFWVGQELWTAYANDLQSLLFDANTLSFECDLEPGLRPGVTAKVRTTGQWNTLKLERVSHHISSRQLRTRGVWQ